MISQLKNIGFLRGLVVTLKTTFRSSVTAEYPRVDKRIQVAERFMGFPALLWDSNIVELIGLYFIWLNI